MNSALNNGLVDAPDSGPAADWAFGAAGAPQARAAERVNCFHCGEHCPDFSYAEGDKTFCCPGCLMVHDLLAQNGLEHFYDLGLHPGVRVRRGAGRERWTYLDEPALQQRLLDFTDGKISRVTFHLPAIHCVACVWLLENLFRLHPGIGRSRVHFPRREVALSFAAEQIKLSELAALLASLGYEPSLTLDALEKKAPLSIRKRQWIQIGIAGFGFGNIMLFSLPAYLGLDHFSGPLFKSLFGYLSLAFALPVLIYSASDYWKSALFSARQRRLTLDVPIALGLAALYAQSVYEVFSGRGAGYLDSLAGLVFLLLVGRAFQQKSHERLAFDRDYKSFFPLAAVRKTERRPPPAGSETGATAEEPVSLSQLQVGDRIVLRHGELVPADCTLVLGPALIDYSFVTGESEPVVKSAGDYLYAGGRQIGGAIEAETVKPVSQSYLASLWDHEAFRKAGKEDFNTLTHRYSRRFTRVVIGVALGAACFWFASGNPARALKAFTSVLIVACPCALALAAPFTLGTAQRRLARRGVFLRNALVLERMARVDAIVLDKTGTLTTARVAAVSFQGEPLDAADKRRLYSLARHSAHPHSSRVSEWLAGQRSPEPVLSFRETAGCGIEGLVQGREILLGSRGWLESRGVTVPPSEGGSVAARGLEACAISASTVHAAIGGRFRGVFTLSNPVRPEIDRLLRELGRRYEIALLSGDTEKERERFQNLFAGDSRLRFNQSPLDKLGFIRGLQQSGKTVMMVGDGLNDAGALKQSDVGVAVVEETGAFSPASDVILEGGQVPCLFETLTLARRAALIVRLSFGISALYNLAGIGIAAAGMLSPLICAILMPLSSISVVGFACAATNGAARNLGLGRKASPPAATAAAAPEWQPAF